MSEHKQTEDTKETNSGETRGVLKDKINGREKRSQIEIPLNGVKKGGKVGEKYHDSFSTKIL